MKTETIWMIVVLIVQVCFLIFLIIPIIVCLYQWQPQTEDQTKPKKRFYACREDHMGCDFTSSLPFPYDKYRFTLEQCQTAPRLLCGQIPSPTRYYKCYDDKEGYDENDYRFESSAPYIYTKDQVQKSCKTKYIDLNIGSLSHSGGCQTITPCYKGGNNVWRIYYWGNDPSYQFGNPCYIQAIQGDFEGDYLYVTREEYPSTEFKLVMHDSPQYWKVLAVTEGQKTFTTDNNQIYFLNYLNGFYNYIWHDNATYLYMKNPNKTIFTASIVK